MPRHRTLWRIQGGAPTDPARWAANLALHLQHSTLTSVTMTIQEQAQSYVILEGCGRCLVGDCAIGCHAQLFRRLVTSSLPEGHLTPVAAPQGLAVRPYTQATICWPTRGARPLTAELLAPWEEARLSLHWSWRRGLTVAGVLMVAGEAAPGEALATQGWQSAALPAMGVRWLRRQRLPPALPGVGWGGEVFLDLVNSQASQVRD